MTLPVLAEVVRSGYVEGTHTGSVLVVDADGRTVLERGDVVRPIFPRSSNKPLQAVGLLQAGWQPGDGEEIALATASHNGEQGHLSVVRRMLAAAGLDEQALGCPPQLPLSEPAAHSLLAPGAVHRVAQEEGVAVGVRLGRPEGGDRHDLGGRLLSSVPSQIVLSTPEYWDEGFWRGPKTLK